MKTKNGVIVLEDSTSFSSIEDGVGYTDISGTKFFIPMPLLIRLYEGTKYTFKKRGIDWDDFCESLFEEEK